MRLLKQIFDFYITSSIHVALAVFSLAYITLLEFGLPYDKTVLSFIFFASITGYNFVKYYGIAKWHHRSLTIILKTILVFSLGCFLAMCYYMFQLDYETLIFISVCGLITFFYAIPILPKKLFIDDTRSLRNVSRLKIYLIALVWALVTVLLPLINENYSINVEVLITLFQRFILIIVLMIPFEIRDLKYDDLKLATIPQRIGIKRTKIIGIVFLIGFFLLHFFKNSIKVDEVIVLLIICVVSMVCVVFSKKSQGVYYSAFWVEGIPILWLVLELLIRIDVFPIRF